MEVPQGYKQTSIGVIPADWEVYKLKEILVSDRLGGNYENSEGNAGLPVIKMVNIGRGNISLSKIQYLPIDEKYNEADILKNGDLLFNTRNTLDLVGKVSVWKNELPKALYNSNLLKLEFDTAFVKSNFFMNYLFNSRKVLTRLRSYATGTTSVAAIYSRDLKLLKLALPPLPEQQKIAEILSTWDTAIETCQKTIEQLKQRNKGLAQQLLSGKTNHMDGEDPHKDFHVVGKYVREVSKRNADLQEKRILSVTNSRGFINQSEQFGRELASADLTNYKIIKKGQFAYNPSRVNVGSIDLLTKYESGILSPMYVVFEMSTGNLIPEFLYYHLKTYWFTGHIPMFVQGSVRDSLSFDGFSGMKFYIPEPRIQKEIVEKLETAAAELKLYENKLQNLQQQKKGLMQQLLTGKVRTV
ncbi:MAG: restriction endonuclease subunit S [Weeksellaceae bacterium]|nr:restriction endonuclease subunit S [Weeksellaceae bacterium]